jgi:hypothetical protein
MLKPSYISGFGIMLMLGLISVSPESSRACCTTYCDKSYVWGYSTYGPANTWNWRRKFDAEQGNGDGAHKVVIMNQNPGSQGYAGFNNSGTVKRTAISNFTPACSWQPGRYFRGSTTDTAVPWETVTKRVCVTGNDDTCT